jgi:chaperone BCS1
MSSLGAFAQNHMALANHSHFNASSGPLRLPLTVLEAVLPGTALVASFLLGFGVDASLVVSWIAVITAAWATLRYGLTAFVDPLVKAFSSCVVVEEYDPIYGHVLSWASAQKNLQNIRSLRSQTAGQYYDAFADGYDEDDNHQLQLRESMSEDTIFNFNSWSARAPPQYRPHSSSGWFLHDYRLFRVCRNRDRIASDIGIVYEKERLDILVLWLSPQPIKKLIEEARDFVLARRTSTTTIKRPTPKSQRNSRHQAWTTMASRPSRSMATVVLDNYQKAHILKDFNEFLHPRTARWYSNRGIPYRRGYLFHG